MPKQKTNRSAVKRFKVSGTGKIMRRKGFRSHKLEAKSSKRTRELEVPAEVTGNYKKQIEKLIGRR